MKGTLKTQECGFGVFFVLFCFVLGFFFCLFVLFGKSERKRSRGESPNLRLGKLWPCTLDPATYWQQNETRGGGNARREKQGERRVSFERHKWKRGGFRCRENGARLCLYVVQITHTALKRTIIFFALNTQTMEVGWEQDTELLTRL